ncbi:MAG TPA: MBOAT family O-acyltransferase [Humisphaera sp.]|jgi:D-alanyl-lipoteichoic acid acyltransferase DltB (MBOAT superfamily)|nr:MBOAT family O-acyltransferase [Humisphaera sp.]
MLFFKWEFLVFMAVVLPGFYALRRTRFWIPWLLAASYIFYARWNPYYLLLVIYSTALDYLLVTLMDHCPRTRGISPPPGLAREARHAEDDLQSKLGLSRNPGEDSQRRLLPYTNEARDSVLNGALLISLGLAATLIGGAAFGPSSLRPTFIVFSVLVLLMALGAWQASRRVWLFISIVNNLTLLLFFKYARFVEQNLNQLFASLHASFRLHDPSSLMPHGFAYLLPVGISFFTFQSMSYTIDFYLAKVARERNILRFATFVCFFPQLMAGPIERARQMLPQFQQAPPFRLQNLTDGASLFLGGLFKKVAIANYLGIYVERVYGTPTNYSAPTLALATVAFAWQIYADFSGYTDMARGLARMMGFHLVINFNHPYLSSGLGEFWTRWHISLSTWFRDYLYIPLGGNRRGTLATYRNLLIVFVVSGIWHGAAWTYVIWGLLHAIGIMLTRELERSQFYRERIPKIAKQIGVFAFVCFAWIFFRASSLSDAGLIIGRIFSSLWTSPQVPALMLAIILAVWLYQWMCESGLRQMLRFGPLRVAIAASMMIYLSLCATGGGAFIYFQF